MVAQMKDELKAIIVDFIDVSSTIGNTTEGIHANKVVVTAGIIVVHI
jgi:hypothetical protein